MNRTISREQIFSAAEKAGFKRIEACREEVPFKACSNDVWKGEIVAFVAELEGIGGIGWQQAVTWLCQHCCEFADIGSLVSAMREAAPATTHPSQPAASEAARDTKRLDFLCDHVINVRDPLRHGSRDMFWASPTDDDSGHAPSNLRALIDTEIERLDRAEGE